VELFDDEEPGWLILPENGFAVLMDELRFADFAEELERADGIRMVYFVTNSEEAFREMSSDIRINDTYQLYRDYIDNFVLCARRETA
jgi:adenine-specific DNA-methyltransferase